MIFSLILTVFWIVVAIIILSTEPKSTDTVIRFCSCLIISSMWSVSYFILSKLKGSNK